MSNSLQPHGLKSTRFLCAWDFPDKTIGVGCLFLLQGSGLNLGLLDFRQILYHLNHQGAYKKYHDNMDYKDRVGAEEKADYFTSTGKIRKKSK